MKINQPTFKLTVEESTDDFAQINIEPLEQGFGHTLGNSIRRVLLGHIPGAAITSVQINGVNHQFTTLEGMKEDVIDLILNLKQIRVSYKGEEPVTATLKASGPGEVKAEQIEFPSGVELANPDLVLANLADKKNKLEVSMTIESGVGYSPAEDREVSTLGVIPVDATFSPISRVDFNVSDTRVGRVTNFDKLQLKVWTDGTVSGEEAVKTAAEIIKLYFQQITDPIDQPVDEEETNQQNDPEVYKITVEELELPTRIANALRKAGIGTVKDLVYTKKDEISKIKNLGNKSLDIIQSALDAKEVSFVEDEEN